MGFSDFFNNSQESKGIDLLDIFYESANRFIKNNKRAITREGDDGKTCLVLSEQYVSELLQYINKDVSKATDNYIKQKYSSTSNDSVRNSDLKKVLDQVSSDVKRIDKNALTGTTYEKGENKYFLLPRISDKQEETLNAVNLVLSQIQNVISKQEDSIRDQSKIIENQHNSILRYENDVLFKSKKELLMELIGIADQIKYTLDDQYSSKDYATLLEAVQSLGEWVNGSLQTETVRKYEKTDLDNTSLDSKTQEVIGVEETEKIEEDGKYKTILPGYFWTMPVVGSSIMQNIQPTTPRSFEFVLRPEQVVRLKYVSKNIKVEDLHTTITTVSKFDDSKHSDYAEPKQNSESEIKQNECLTISFDDKQIVDQKNVNVEHLLKSSPDSLDDISRKSLDVSTSKKGSTKDKVAENKPKRKN